MIEESKLPETIRSIPEALSHWAERTPDAVAMLAPGREPATYRELHDAVTQLATELRARGFGQNDGIALLFPGGADFCLALLAAMSVGVAIPLAWPAQEKEEGWPRLMGHVRAVLTSAELGLSAPKLAQQGLPVITVTTGGSGRVGDFRLEGESCGAPILSEPPTADDRALILQSSGTTGRPKLAPITHGNIVSLMSRRDRGEGDHRRRSLLEHGASDVQPGGQHAADPSLRGGDPDQHPGAGPGGAAAVVA